MKRVEQIIDMSRKLSGNTRFDNDSGVPQDVFVQYLNNAQDSLTKEVVNLKTKFLKKTSTIPVVSGQETYSYPDGCYMQHIDTIKWRDTLTGSYFQTLVKCYTKEKLNSKNGYPFGYIMENDGYHLNPPISTGYLEQTFIKEVPRLQKRCGIVSAVTIVSNQVTALSVNISDLTYDSAAIADDYFFCVVDKFGNQKAVNIEYTNNVLGVFTVPAHTLLAGESVAVGNFIVVGKNSTNIPEWPDVCESYLIKHMVYDAKYSDSSNWSQQAKDDMVASFTQLAGSFASLSDDICEIPVTNLDYIGF